MLIKLIVYPWPNILNYTAYASTYVYTSTLTTVSCIGFNKQWLLLLVFFHILSLLTLFLNYIRFAKESKETKTLTTTSALLP